MIEIKINCTGSHEFKLSEVQILQEIEGEFNLKELSEKDFDKLRLSIESDGISSPFYFWEDKQKKKWYLDGAQRDKVLDWMTIQKGDYKLPEKYPFIQVFAKDIKEAARKILIFNSRYGKIVEDGLYGFIHKFALQDDISELETKLNLLDVDLKRFEDGYILNEMNTKGNNGNEDIECYEINIEAQKNDYNTMMPQLEELLRLYPNVKYKIKDQV